MKVRVFAILPLVWLIIACEPTATSSSYARPFPPQTVSDFQRLVRSLAPIDIPSSASEILSARVSRTHANYTNLFSYFFAFRCSAIEAAQIIRTDSSLDNSVTVNEVRIRVTNDILSGADRPIISPSRFPAAPVFPDVLYERGDLSDRSLLTIRVSDAPEWFTPHTMRRGIADRCIWKRGQIQVEFYFDADRQTMFLRFDELRPA